MLQDGPKVIHRVFFLTGAPLNFLSKKSFYNLWHLEKFGASFHGILYLENLGGLQKKTSYVYLAVDSRVS